MAPKRTDARVDTVCQCRGLWIVGDKRNALRKENRTFRLGGVFLPLTNPYMGDPDFLEVISRQLNSKAEKVKLED